MILLEIPSDYAPLLVLLFPLLPLILVATIHYLLKSRPSNRVVRHLSHLMKSPKLISPPTSSELTQFERKALFKRNLVTKLGLVYIAILLFFLSNIIAEFYLVWIDVSMPVNQGSTGDMRTWSSMVINTPFSSGWLGTFPWYNGFSMPPMGLDVYHDVWSWIFFTATLTDNPYFFSTVVTYMFILSSVLGLIFLLPLTSKRVRGSYFPSIFLVATSMLVMTRWLFTCYAQAWKLQYGGASIQYGLVVVTEEIATFTNSVISGTAPFILLFYFLFALIGWKLAGTHYPNNNSYRRWFIVFLSIVYWMSLVYSVVMP